MSSGRATIGGGRKPLNQNQTNKRKRLMSARSIRTEAVISSGANKTGSISDISESGGMLKVDQFVNSRQFEIKELQIAMHRSKTSGATRVFQSLPRKLRRRTASHNIRRIPKRMRSRALREMLKNEQQTILPNKGSKRGNSRHGLTAKALYKAKMSIKLLRLASKSVSMRLTLPDDVTSSKHKVRQRIRLLRKMINDNNSENTNTLNNDLGSYDNTAINQLCKISTGRIKYTKRQQLFSWLPSHIWNAKRSHMIKRWGYQIPWSATQKCFKLTHRIGSGRAASDGALCSDTSYIGTIIVTTDHCNIEQLKNIVSRMTNKRGILHKYYHSGNFFEGLLYELDLEKTTNAKILGSLNLLWIDEKSVMLRLHPSLFCDIFRLLLKYKDILTIQDCRYSIASMSLSGSSALSVLSSILRSTSNSKSFQQLKKVSRISDYNVLPEKMIFGFPALDPRFLGSPKKLNQPKRELTAEDIINLETDYPTEEINSTLSKLCSPVDRENSYKNQQTLKQLGKRRDALLKDDSHQSTISFNEEKDSTIPIIVIKRPSSNDWLIMLPWYWLLPLWYQIHKIPKVFNIGLRQTQQLQFEKSMLYFPDDYPFTDVGYLENSVYKRDSVKSKWSKKPLGKRVNFNKIQNVHNNDLPSFTGEIGDYFSCDWRLLQIVRNGVAYLKNDAQELRIINQNQTTQFDEYANRTINVLNDLFELYKDTIPSNAVSNQYSNLSLPIELKTSKAVLEKESNIILKSQEIYERPLPVVAVSCLLTGKGHPKDNARIYMIPREHQDYWTKVQNGIFRADGTLMHEPNTPLPNAEHLIGFITSGTYNLGTGCGHGNGFISANFAFFENNNLVLVRNVGTNTYRLAEWSQILV